MTDTPMTKERISHLLAKIDDALRGGATMLGGKDLIVIRDLLDEKLTLLDQHRPASARTGPGPV